MPRPDDMDDPPTRLWQPEISIISGTRHRPDEYQRFINSVRDAATLPTEIIITDASDKSDYARDVLAYREPIWNATVIHEKPRLGTLRGYNVGFRKARGRYVVWFNDDCELEKGWDAVARDYMDAHPEIGIGAIYFKDAVNGELQSYYAVQTWQGMHYANFGVVRREVGQQVDWFDERCGRMYGCDNSICLNVLQAGFAVVPIPGCKVKHWRTMDMERVGNLDEANADAAKLGTIWHGDYSGPKRVYDQYAYLHQPESII